MPAGTKAIVALAFCGGIATVAASAPGSSALQHLSGAQWAIGAAVCALIVVTWTRPLVLYRGSESQAFHIDEALFVVLALLEPPAATVYAFAAATIASQLIKRRAPAKSVFNFGQTMVSVGVGLAVSRSISVPGAHPGMAAIGATLLGAALFLLIGNGAVSAVLASTGASWRQPLAADASMQVTLAGVGSLVGCLVAVSTDVSEWAPLLGLPVLVIVRLVLSAQFNAVHDRVRMEGLFTVTLEANRALRKETVIESVLASARELLRCPVALLTDEFPGPGALAAHIDVPDHPQWLVVSGRRREEPFDHADRILVEAIAAIARGALTNADLYRQVRYEQEKLSSITLNIGEGVCALDARGSLSFVNPAAAAMINVPLPPLPSGQERGDGGDASGERPRAPEFLLAPARLAMATGEVVRRDDAVFEGHDGAALPVAFTASAVRENGQVCGAVIAFRDITERKRLEMKMAENAAEMEHRASHDSLTGLPNRRMLVEKLEQALAASRSTGAVHALIFVDVDRFKAINDSLGHGTGDDLLAAVGARMQHAVPDSALLARVGGDEFVVHLEGVGEIARAEQIAEKIIAAVREPLVLSDGYEIVASVSMGIALTEPGQTADDILRDADVAMYRAKGCAGSYQVFDKSLMGTRSAERIELESALRKALDRGELEVHYQPIVSVSDLSIVGAEALVRWRHPTEGLIPPGRFIPVAEETGLILALGKFVLETSCRQVRAVRDRLGVDVGVSVNLSPRQFQQSTLFTDVMSVLDRAGLPSHLLTFEITETMVMDDIVGASEVMKKLNRMGVRLAIDDFGTGHSSLGYLKEFPVHEVKVDRIFVNGVASDPVDTAIIRAVVDLAEAMGIDAVAEGVETREQLAGLRMLGCHQAQGFHFSKPLPAEDYDRLLAQHFASEQEASAAQPPELRVLRGS